MNSERMRGLRLAPVNGSTGGTPIRDLDLLILVGVTGVGKSTVLDALRRGELAFSSLPDRRVITDVVMIEPLAGGPVSDREERFRLTARYREAHPGGMAQALSELVVDTDVLPPPLLFDGLRGEDEVRFAAAHLPRARFVSLHAPDEVRVRRLLGRGDRFDRVAATDAPGDLHAFLVGIPGIREVFGPDEIARIAALASPEVPAEDVVAKTRIVVTERRHYDPQAANAVLATLVGERALVLDTSVLSPDDVTRRVVEWV